MLTELGGEGFDEEVEGRAALLGAGDQEVQTRSHQRWPMEPRVPWVILRSIMTWRMVCSVRLFVVGTPRVVRNVK